MTTGYGTPGMEIGGGRVPSEEWRATSHIYYEVSNLGQVRSFVSGAPRILSPVLDSYGYHTIRVHSLRFKVHRLVCEAFHGPPPSKADAAHLDGNRTNNRADNLRWTSRRENMAHKRLHGTAQTGERGPGAKLTQAQVDEIRRRASDGEGRPALAKEFGIARGHLRRIIIGEAW